MHEEENTDTTTKMPETKRICVIGASGVVGSHVCQTALRKGYKVRMTKTFIIYYFKKLVCLSGRPIHISKLQNLNLD